MFAKSLASEQTRHIIFAALVSKDHISDPDPNLNSNPWLLTSGKRATAQRETLRESQLSPSNLSFVEPVTCSFCDEYLRVCICHTCTQVFYSYTEGATWKILDLLNTLGNKYLGHKRGTLCITGRSSGKLCIGNSRALFGSSQSHPSVGVSQLELPC